MKTIKFSHRYPKILDHHGDVIRHAILLSVSVVDLEKLSKEFLDYDTDDGAYKLPPSGDFLLLLFEKPYPVGSLCSRNLFTTLRPYNAGKLDYYKNSVGDIFTVVCTAKSDKTAG